MLVVRTTHPPILYPALSGRLRGVFIRLSVYFAPLVTRVGPRVVTVLAI